MTRVHNFSAGPSVLPLPVLEKAAAEMTNYRGTGMSVMEMSHRSPAYEAIINSARDNLRKLMAIPENYEILFMQGGASTQFAAIPLNLLGDKESADYVSTGAWSKKAISEAKKYCNVNVIASSEDKVFNYIPELDSTKFNKDAAYFHITSNNTIYGTAYKMLPDTAGVPIVTDMSSSILSEVIDVSKFGMIYAGAQKNIGPAGVTVVIIRKDLMGKAKDFTPTMLKYDTCAENDSMYNTPPTYGIYIAGLVFEWLLELGGIEAIQKQNIKKAELLYGYLDQSAMFSATVRKEDRSLMNVPFVTGDNDLDKKFVKEAEAAGLVNLKGHRSVGGMRASIYNAVDYEGVKALVDFMQAFELSNTK